MKFTGIYSIIVGVLMLAQWTFFIAAGQVPELKTAPFSIAFHLVAEGCTALSLIISGVGLLNKRTWARTAAFVSLGMLLYTVIVSPGYFAQQGVWPLVGMFMVLLVLALVSLRLLLQTHSDAPQ
jgi:hypothetical protein